MVDAERVALRWIDWLSAAACCEAVPAIRIDFLVIKPGACGKDNACRVRTLELTEMGFSMLGWDEGPTVVFPALAEELASEVRDRRSRLAKSCRE